MARNFFKQAIKVLKQLGAQNSIESKAARVSPLTRSVQLVEPLRPLGPNYPLWVTLGGLLAYEATLLSSGTLAEPVKQPAPATVEDGLAVYRRERRRHGLPKEIILYQYEVCPFCNKVRAFLDFHKVPYRTVEVNPLTKKQLQWSKYRKVPVVLLDQEAINDSSVILSRLAIEFEPELGLSPSRGWFSSIQKAAAQSDSVAEEEEIKWRKWVDKKFVQLLTVNIYRSLRESWQTFDYITQHGNFSFSERQAARVAGSGLMYFVSGKMIKKNGIEGDVREALYAAANEWVAAVGGRRFMGGDGPNLADLSVFGVIRSITGTSTFTDLTHNSRIGPWYERMMGAVGESSQLPDPSTRT